MMRREILHAHTVVKVTSVIHLLQCHTLDFLVSRSKNTAKIENRTAPSRQQ